MLEGLWQGMHGLLEDEQRGSWRILRGITRLAFGGSYTVKEYGLESPRVESSILGDWQAIYGLEDGQGEAMRPLAHEYVSQARILLDGHGQNVRSLSTLEKDDRVRIEREFLELQRRFEARLVPGLSEEQQLEFLDRNPSLLRFNHGKTESSSSRTGMF